jgi:hypothetical protein
MKVAIGPYPKKSIDRKISVRIDKYDTWSMDSTLAHIVVPMLKQLKKTTHGAPNTDDADVPAHLKSTADKKPRKEHECDKFHFKRWAWILGEMIFAFEGVNKDWEKRYQKGKIDHLWQAYDKKGNKLGEAKRLGDRQKIVGVAYYETVEGPKHTYVADYEGMKRYRERMQNGFNLFGKYYMALWD